jgi:plasmid stabilization system protein ParE
MTMQVSVLPAAERDIDGQADYLFRETSLETEKTAPRSKP